MLVKLIHNPYVGSVKDGFIRHKMYRMFYDVDEFDAVNLVDFMTGEVLPKPIPFRDVKILTDRKEIITGMFNCARSCGKFGRG